MNHLDRRRFLQMTAAGSLAGLLPTGCAGPGKDGSGSSKRPNVLFVIVDDLRPELGCYGNQEIKTPNFDRLAGQSVLFSRCYCQAAACAPSRASVMTGMRPDSTRVWTLADRFRKTVPDVVTMPQHFKKFGYHTVSIGKIFHNHVPDRVSFDEPDLRPAAYSTPEMIDRDPESFYHEEENIAELARVRARRLAKKPDAYAGGWAYGRSHEITDAPDEALYDGAQTTLALETLKRLKERDEPFYLAMGYYRPHLPFVAPRKYWELYDRDRITPAPNPFTPRKAPHMAMNAAYELTACYDLEYVKHPALGQLPPETARMLKHGYYASVSYVDACLGRLMDGLEELGLADDTIVVLWGDHGWKLGEHGSWCKQTNYNIDTRVPMMIRAPGMAGMGGRCESLTELVDLYPTLCDLAGIDVPECMEGTSLRPLLTRPAGRIKQAAFSQYCQRPKNTLDGKRYMGYSMVTGRYHFAEWYRWDHERSRAGEKVGVELYDLDKDPQENLNVAGDEPYRQVVEELARKRRAGWRAARCP